MIASAEGIAAGSLAAARMNDEIALLNSSATTVYDCSVDALNQLHAMLSPAERSVISDKLEAHWEIWRQVNDEAEAGDHGKGSRLNDLDIELGLSTDQVERISVALKAAFAAPSTFEVKKADAQVKAFADAFEKPVFDAKSVTPELVAHLAAEGIELDKLRSSYPYDTWVRGLEVTASELYGGEVLSEGLRKLGARVVTTVKATGRSQTTS